MNLLSKNVLVLNKNYLAIKVISVKDAICVLYKEQARVIDENYDTYNLREWAGKSIEISINKEESEKYKHIISSPSISFFIPKVIIQNTDKYIKELTNVRYSRKNVYARDEYKCCYCNYEGTAGELTLDHVIPKSKGGENIFTNIVTCCKKCNAKKSNKTLEEVGMKLLKKPIVPKWKSFIGKPFGQTKNKYWEKFL